MSSNHQKLHEALEELMKFTCNSCERRLCEDDAEEEDGLRVPSPCTAIIRARNALSAPPRNCDRFCTASEAKKEFMTIEELPEGCGDWDMREWFRRCLEWLFAPATERKGDDDGSK